MNSKIRTIGLNVENTIDMQYLLTNEDRSVSSQVYEIKLRKGQFVEILSYKFVIHTYP